MTKVDLTSAVAARGFSSRQAASAVDAVLKTIFEALERGEDVTLGGFGQFQIRRKAARRGRNLRTGLLIDIPARRVVRFRASRELKRLVDRGQGSVEGSTSSPL